ncbi:hypothetical protein QQ008_20300 [Fulvivirgaceae bacterium BMA10]|uniref:HEAT repeat domain-containing protein n=1 Tax=Splendidivirga corallicola TaxID=3051826 RepID=A0ABT8KTP5_9BACT|nr:hypothetical protein [Fulvivirgaceae bacterium BMA10]
MNIREELLREHSKAQAQRIADYIGNDQGRFDELLNLFLYDEYRVIQRSAWIVGICGKQYPHLFEPHLEKVINNLKNPVHDAVKRNTLRVLQDMDIPEELMGEAADLCFQYLNSNKEPVAIKVFAMTVLCNIVKKVPELKEELQIIIEDQMPYGSAGFISRGKKVLRALEKIDS